MKRERIIKIWRFCYMYFLKDGVEAKREQWMSYQDNNRKGEKAQYDCYRIFWRFYWIENIVDL